MKIDIDLANPNEYEEISESFSGSVYKFPIGKLIMLERAWHKFLIARTEGNVVGILTVQFHPGKPTVLSIETLQTHQNFLRRGIGTTLLLAAEKIKTPNMKLAEGRLDNPLNLASANTFFRAGYHNHGAVDFTKEI